MFEVRKTDTFDIWFIGSRTVSPRPVSSLVFAGSDSAIPETGHLSAMVSLRCDSSRAGYRVYYKQTGPTIVLLLCGGDKASQTRDIKRAKQIAANS